MLPYSGNLRKSPMKTRGDGLAAFEPARPSRVAWPLGREPASRSAGSALERLTETRQPARREIPTEATS